MEGKNTKTESVAVVKNEEMDQNAMGNKHESVLNAFLKSFILFHVKK